MGQITPFLEVVLDGGKLLLNTSHVNYSYGSLHDIFHKTFKKLNIREREIKNVLILGFGAGSIASLLTDTLHKNCTITGVEADKVVIELAKKHFNISRVKKLNIHETDAYNFVLKCTEKYDLIAVDIFVDDETPQKFSDDQFLSAISNLLTPSGIICYNRMISVSKSEKHENELIESFNKLIGPNSIMKYYSGDRTNWMIIHDRALLTIRYGYKKNNSKKLFSIKLSESI
ncbi:MAG: methyltransferase domain-containing protein [Bacteroidetes bacterium]|nr:methyltransferase domain-containing protein [Bacteroidota bacterium]